MAIIPAVLARFLGLSSNNAAITNALKNIIPNSINHIMQSKHAWSQIGSNNWSTASKAIEYVLKYGSSSAYNAGNTIYTAVYNGKTVQVVTRIVGGSLRIVDAWVKTK